MSTPEYADIPGGGYVSWKEPVATAALLPANGNQPGDARVTQDTGELYIFNGTSWVASTGGGGSGTVTSVGLTDATGTFNISGSPVTGSGNLTIASLATQGASKVLAAPTGSAGTPMFRALVPADIPTLTSKQAAYLYTLVPTDIANGYITLPFTPISPTATLLTVVGGPMQDYGADYTVSGNTLSWSGLGLAGIMTSGDQLIIDWN